MERRLFEDLIESDAVRQRTGQSVTFPVSIALHAVMLVAVVIVPLLTSEELPEPSVAARAFFIEPAAVPPPPPPPPPASRAAEARTPVRPPAGAPAFVAPVEVPEEVRPEAGPDPGSEGVPGGVEGGVVGGVVGSVVGGLPDGPPPTQAVRVGGQIKEPRKLKDIRPAYPDIAKQARVQGVVILECTISPQGRVTNVTLVRGIPLLDQAAIDAVKQWVYTPTLLNGVPVPVILSVRMDFKLGSPQ